MTGKAFNFCLTKHQLTIRIGIVKQLNNLQYTHYPYNLHKFVEPINRWHTINEWPCGKINFEFKEPLMFYFLISTLSISFSFAFVIDQCHKLWPDWLLSKWNFVERMKKNNWTFEQKFETFKIQIKCRFKEKIIISGKKKSV